MKFRTTKEVQTSLHDEETNLLEFKFRYERIEDGLFVKSDTYKVVDENTVELIGGGASYRKIKTGEGLEELITASKAITPANDNPLDYMDDLIKSGIKIVITKEGLWKNVLTLTDFE